MGGVDHPTYFRINDALKTARAMNATVVRSHTLGTSLGCPKCIQPEAGEFNEDAFAPIDYAIARARAYGLRLIVPLTDQWDYYHGGYPTMAKWLGLKEPKDFYTDPRAKAAYKDYVRHVLDHVNPYTGLAYKNDPTIMSWELGNELNDMTRDWVDEMGAHVGRLAPRHLISMRPPAGSRRRGPRIRRGRHRRRALLPVIGKRHDRGRGTRHRPGQGLHRRGTRLGQPHRGRRARPRRRT